MKAIDFNDVDYNIVSQIYNKYFSLGHINSRFVDKIALISMICYLTDYFNKDKDEFHKISCYKVIQKIGGKKYPELVDNFYKSLAVICEDMMYGCKEFETFGVNPKDMPKEILRILNTYLPF